MSCSTNRVLVRAVTFVFIGLLSLSVMLRSAAVVAQEATTIPAVDSIKGLPNSLRFVPQDASAYFSLLNNRVKWDAIAGSDAVQEFLATPAGQKIKNELLQHLIDDLRNQDPDELPSWGRDALSFIFSEQGRASLPLLANLVSQEVFVFADGSLDQLLTQFDNAIQTALPTLSEPPSGAGLPSIPRVVVGARLTGAADRHQVVELLTLLESAFRNNVFALSERENEFLSQSLRRETQGSDHDVWTLQIDFRDYPWDAALTRLKNDPRVEDLEAAVQEMEYRREHAPSEPVVFTIGIQHGYLIATIASEQHHRAELLAAQPLYKTKIFAPLLAKRNLVFSGVGYRSSVYQQQTSWINTYAPILPIVASSFRANLAEREIDPEVAEKLADDVDADLTKLRDDLKNAFTPAGDRLNFSYLYNGGIAGYQYHLHREPLTVKPQPLEVLKHVGPNPLYFHASADWDSEDHLQGWMQRIEMRARQIAAAVQPAGAENPLLGILSTIFTTTKDQLLPSLGNQSAYVIDLSMRSKNWHVALPASQTELPVPAVALVYQLRDAAQHRLAWRQYYQTIAPLTAAVAPLAGLPPGSELPAATETEIDGGTFLHLPGVSALGAESRFSPGLALSEQWAVYALFPSQAAMLLRPSTPRLPPPLNDIERPLIAATYFNFQQLGEAIQQWVDYSQPMIESALRQEQPPANDLDEAAAKPLSDLSPAETLELGKMLLRTLQSVQSYSRASYTQDNTVVTQYLFRIPTLQVTPPVAEK